MKETGIMMSGNHPKLILDGTKTMTRRTWGLEEINKDPDAWCISGQVGAEWGFGNLHCEKDIIIKCPYGQVGDRLWVRETWIMDVVKGRDLIRYKADDYDFAERIGCRWRPSRFMPRWASRITLEITEIRVERVQEITEKDAEAEGLKCWEYDNPNAYADCPCTNQFLRLWDSLNAKRGYSRDTNPWVWVISFKRIDGWRLV